ncbi:hypothetical protein [Streptomyces sp. H27-D2]|uniref:hypothetical protein n=1 Tax=Streptomyces sp. H27-D2 TaxID=3046304 RepID=UPI002DBCD044|nr:hypothetical protein [Streptomyces sp. H27-D2]MEC4014852.1 hypothetical protein [Streptomyces sp. H27-D2]
MSYNQPPPQNGPYGGGQPNPYGGGQPGSGYPQQGGQAAPQQGYGQQAAPHGQPPQQAAGPYGQPQQPHPYGQQPGGPGQQPPYGQLPMPQQGGGKKMTGIIVGSVVALAAIVAGVFYFTQSDGEVAAYKIVLPRQVLDGSYTKMEGAGGSRTEKLGDDEKTRKLGITNGTGVSGSYKGDDKSMLMVAGAYGDIADPEKTVDTFFAQTRKAREEQAGGSGKIKTETVSEMKSYSPDGFDGAVMKCETTKTTGASAGAPVSIETSMCVWGDSSAVALVQQMGRMGMGAGSKARTAEELSEATAKIRDDARVELKK